MEESMRISRYILASCLVASGLSVLLGVSAPVLGAGLDNNVEWNGISHIEWQDRRPLCPVGNEVFAVRFQSYQNDLSSARLFLDDGGATQWITASVIEQRGPYDVWEVSIPATSSSSIDYYIELTDGSDTDFISVSGMSDGTPVDGGWVLNFTTLDHAPVGATLATGGAVFKVWAPGATTCYVRGDFNGWGLTHSMTRVGEHFIKFVSGAGQGDNYKYYFNPGAIWKSDARARAFNSANNQNSILENPFGYSWQEDDFQTPLFEEMIVYQLHLGTFAGRNDPFGGVTHPSGYAEVAARVSHLVDLGINAVMLNPVNEFPGDHSAGYNPISMWAPEWAYGSADELKNMVDVLHQNGIAVILDIIWNHFSFDDNYLWYYDGTQFYFDDPAVETPWGSQADMDRDGVRDYFLHSALHWLEEYRLDGFRMDATSYMTLQAGGWSLMQEFNDLIDNRFADKIVIAEQLPDDDWVTRPTSIGGAGFDTQYFDYFTDSMRQEIFDAAMGDPEMWRIRDIIDGGGTYLSGLRVFNYIELHDEAWPSSGGQRIVKSIDTTSPHDDIYARGRVKLGQGVTTLAPGIPAFLMGLDWLEDTDFGTDAGNRIDWSKKTTYADHFLFFKHLHGLRKNEAFFANANHTVYHLNESGNVIGFRRWSGDDDFVVLANFSNTDYSSYRIGIPQSGDWWEPLNSQDPLYGGTGTVNGGTLTTEAIARDGFDQSFVIHLSPMALVVLQKGDPTGVGGQTSGSSINYLAPNFPNPFNPSTTIRFSIAQRQHTSLRIYDVSGRLIRTLINEMYPQGRHEVRWDGRNNFGEGVASGVYFYRLVVPEFTETRKMVLLK
jgi:1,4-alpha-glucan branching enzyme